MNWEPVIGLEVHVQLNTRTKLFCGCPTRFGASQNSQVCPVCLGFPGTLPVCNRRVMEAAIKAALMLDCEIAQDVVFERKNYFYPDLPKAYQISQYQKPVGLKGFIDITVEGRVKRIGVTRLHVEEDAGKLVHPETGDGSGVDYNRTGVPLIEIVSEPDIRTPEEAAEYLKNLKQRLMYLGVSDCNMEEGSLRCDANVSVRPAGESKLGTKVEVKNMNSFKNVAKAIEYEIARLIDLSESGGRIIQETRLWDADKQKTFSMRSKEKAHDYRYFPDPDLVPFSISAQWVEELRKTLPETPEKRRERFIEKLGLPAYDSDVLCASKELADFFEETLSIYTQPKAVSNWIMSELLKEMNRTGRGVKELGFHAKDLASLLDMIEKGAISGKIAKEVFAVMFETGKDPCAIVKEKGLGQISGDAQIREFVRQAIAANDKSAADYLGGKMTAITFLVGQVMKLSRGKANPALVNQILKEELEKRRS